MKPVLCISVILIAATALYAGLGCEVVLNGHSYYALCDQVWVKYEEGATETEIDSVRTSIGGNELDHPLPQWRLYELTTGMSVEQAIASAKEASCVLVAHPEYMVEPCIPYEVPDPFWPDQRKYLGTDPGDNYPPVNSLGFKLDKIWAIEQGDPEIYLNVMDTGSPDHVDNCGPIEDHPDHFHDPMDPTTARFVRFWQHPATYSWSGCDFNGHGTIMLSIVGAIANSVGMAGINHTSPILVSKLYHVYADRSSGQDRAMRRFIDAVSYLLYDDPMPDRKQVVLFAFQWMIEWAGVWVADCSQIESWQYFQLVEDVIHEALHTRNILFVFPSGQVDRYGFNDGIGCPAWYSSCGSYEDHTEGYDNVISVGAYTNYRGAYPYIPIWRNHSPLVNIYAPGGHNDTVWPATFDTTDIVVGTQWHTLRECMPWEIQLPPDWGRFSGTSVAAAHAAGVISLIWSSMPEMSPGQLKQLILSTAENPTYSTADCRGHSDYWGYGGIDGLSAILECETTTPVELAYDLVMDNTLDNCTMGNRPVRIHRPIHIGDNTVLRFHAEVLPITVALGASKEIDVHCGGTLEITGENDDLADLDFVMGSGARVVVDDGGSIVAESANPDHPIRFSGGKGIFVYGTGTFTNCEFKHSSWGVKAMPGAVVTLNNCTFDSCAVSVGCVGASVTMNYCTIKNQGQYGILESGGQLSATNCDVSGAKRSGLWTLGYGTAVLDQDRFHANGGGPGASYMFGGMRNTFSALRLHCVTSDSNTGPGLAAFGGYADMVCMAPPHNNGKNVIRNNFAPAQGQTRTQIYFESANFDLCNGRNEICAGDGLQIMDAMAEPLPHDVTNNYWCGRHEYPSEYVNRGDDIASTHRCELPDLPRCLEREAQALFHDAWVEENSMLYDQAYLGYKYVLEHFPSEPEAKLCPDRMAACAKAMEWSWEERRDYFLSVADTTNDKYLEFEARATAAWCLVEMEEYEQAIGEFLALLDEADDDYQYQKAALLELMVEMQEEPWESPGKQPAQDDGLQVLDRMESVLAGHHTADYAPASPTAYKLYQSYPNPFNAQTVIRYYLPEVSHVQVEVYNVLGRCVATLADGFEAAGYHDVRWDASSVASGVYIYQIRAGNFMDSKKMVLIR